MFIDVRYTYYEKLVLCVYQKIRLTYVSKITCFIMLAKQPTNKLIKGMTPKMHCMLDIVIVICNGCGMPTGTLTYPYTWFRPPIPNVK